MSVSMVGTNVIASIRRFFLWPLRLYLTHFPIEKGKWRLWALRNWFLSAKDPPRHIAKLKGGDRMLLRPGQYFDQRLYLWGSWEDDIRRCLTALIRPGDTFVDVGAHVGYFTLMGSRLVGETGKVFAFEPVSESRASLCENLCINHVKNVTVHSCALWESEQMLSIQRTNPRNDSTIRLRPQRLRDSYAVPAMTLDQVLKGENNIHFLKIDVEGDELRVLKGFSKHLASSNETLILCEITESLLRQVSDSVELLCQWLAHWGYKPFFIDSPCLELATPEAIAAREQTNVLFSAHSNKNKFPFSRNPR